MREHDDAVLGQMQIRLDGAGADGDGAAEGAHGVLRVRGLVATVGDGLRQPLARGLPW